MAWTEKREERQKHGSVSEFHNYIVLDIDIAAKAMMARIRKGVTGVLESMQSLNSGMQYPLKVLNTVITNMSCTHYLSSSTHNSIHMLY